MRNLKKASCILLLLTSFIFLCSCTAYTEINDLPLVLGVSIDKIDNKFIITAEVFKPTIALRAKENNIITEIVQSEGETIFDGVRDLIIKVGDRVYWTHLKVFIVSKSIANEGLTQVLDFFNRNAHIRKEFPVFVSNDNTAYEIFYIGKKILSEPVSIFINHVVRSSDKVSKYDYVKFYELIDDIVNEGESPLLPLISLSPVAGKQVPSIYGSAVFTNDKMVGTLTTEETKILRLLKNKEKGGLLIVQWLDNENLQKVTLEVFKSKVKLKPVYTNNNLSVNIDVVTSTEIAEILNPNINIFSQEDTEKLRKEAENKIRFDIETLLYKLQHILKSDVIGIGKELKQSSPKNWKNIKGNWTNVFETTKFNTNINIKFKGTATISDQLKLKE